MPAHAGGEALRIADQVREVMTVAALRPDRHSARRPYAADMKSTREASLYAMLTAVEDASPVQAVEAVTRELGAAL